MSFNRFYLKIIMQTALIASGIFLFLLFFYIRKQYTTSIFFAMLAIASLFYLIHYVNKTNRALANFLIYLKENDPKLVFSEKTMEKTFRGLHLSFQEILKEFQKTRRERELQNIYTETIIDNINTGIITYFNNGKIDYINKAAKDLFEVSEIYHIDELKTANHKLGIKLVSMEKSFVAKIIINGKDIEYSVSKYKVTSKEKNYNIITLQDIHKELEAKEIDAWKKLTRVINHEIKNSITPITTLTTAIRRNFIEDSELKQIEEIVKEDILETISSVDIIEERSKGLIDFIQKYSELTKIPEPKKEPIKVAELLNKCASLFAKIFSEKEIQHTIDCDSSVEIEADKKQMEQVIINLLKNSIEASEHAQERSRIKLKAYYQNQKVCIEIEDNGYGINHEELANIFVPFYTTKEEGSGIGLSLSRQIIQLHGGEITAKSNNGFTTFRIENL